MARTLSLRGVRAVTFSFAFARNIASASGLATPKFLRQNAVILNIDILIPFADMLPETSFMAHSNFFEHPLRCCVSSEVVREDPVQPEHLKTKRQRAYGGLCSVSFTPEWQPDPVTEFRVPVWFRNLEPYPAA